MDRRVMAVKIDNHPNARPQSGLQIAEAVIELPVEAGLTRFIALFHTLDTSYIGPIRSIRPTDAALVKHVGAPLQISGGQPWILALVADTGAQILKEAGSGNSTFRIDARQAPQNLYGDTTAMRERADGLGHADDPPAPMFIFGEPTAGTEQATEIQLAWSNGTTVRWVYDGGRYARFHGDTAHEWVDEAGGGGQIAFDTLVVLTARRYTALLPAGVTGSSVPALDTIGSGNAFAFFEGSVVEGSWSRDTIEEPFALTLADGRTMVLPPGRIWISVFPSDRTVSWD